jgi:thiol-disulfide isomerase/thioredoxin
MVARACTYRLRARCLIAVLTLVVGILGRIAWADDAPLPRYRFEVGQQLTYAGDSVFDYGRGSFGERERWIVNVVQRIGDRWRLVIRHEDLSTSGDEKGVQQPTSEATHLVYAELTDRGDLVDLEDSFGFHTDPRKLFPRLPLSGEELASGWTAPAQFTGELNYRVIESPDAGGVAIEARLERPENAIYGFEMVDSFDFDRERGLVEQTASSTKQTWKIRGQGTGKLKRESVETRPRDWCESFARDAEIFFRAQKAFRAATEAPEATPQSFDAAIGALREARERLNHAEFQAQGTHLARRFEEERPGVEADLAMRAGLIGKPAAPFSVLDLEGKPHSLQDYRGQVVLLDFWYRGCGWCIRCMPQLGEVAAQYGGRPVAVLGMNSDENLDDARFAVEKMSIRYPTLQAGDLAKEFGVSAYPTLVVIDRQGAVRGMHVGYSPTLRDQLIAEIDKLLAEPAEKAD